MQCVVGIDGFAQEFRMIIGALALVFFLKNGGRDEAPPPRPIANNSPELSKMMRDFRFFSIRDVFGRVAMKNAAQETVKYLMETRGLSAADAYSLASIGIDFRIAEVVDAVQVVYGAIPKKIFKTNPPYWRR